MNFRSLGTIVGVACLMSPSFAQELLQDLQPAGLPRSAGFGIPAFDGSRLAVGSTRDSHAGIQCGSVRVYASTPAGWEQRALIVPPDPTEFHSFGVPALQGELLVVGAAGADGAAPNSGKVYVHRASGGAFPLEAELELPSGQSFDLFGAVVRLDGSTLMVSAPRRAGSTFLEGAVYVFERDAGLGTWTLVQELLAPVPESGAYFGADLDLEGEMAVIGMPEASATMPADGNGLVHVFERVGGTWIHVQALSGAAAPGTSSMDFGRAVALDGDRLAVGAPGVDASRGAVHVFERGGGTFGSEEIVELPGGESLNYFGYTLALSADRLLVSRMSQLASLASSHLFARTASGWSYQSTFETDGGQSFGPTILALHGSLAAIGYIADNPMGSTHPGHLELHRIPLFAEASCFCDLGAPCANVDELAGCVNSTGAGAVLSAIGSASVAADDLGFRAEGLPALAPAVLFAGAASIPALPLGDGLRCVGGATTRLVTAAADDSGVVAYGPGLVAQGGFDAGDERGFQVWYRDASGGPCSSGTNLTHATRLAFVP